MAAALSQGVLSTIEIRKNYGRKEWKEDLFRMMKRVAIQNKSVVFLFDDQHILQESFLEDVNNLLNSGEIPNLFGKDELDEISNDLGNEARQLKYNNPLTLFNERVRNQFHVVLAMSPVGNLLRPRMRMFPSIVNCTTIDCKIQASPLGRIRIRRSIRFITFNHLDTFFFYLLRIEIYTST